MRTVLRIALEGSAIVALALLQPHCIARCGLCDRSVQPRTQTVSLAILAFSKRLKRVGQSSCREKTFCS